jgi:agmatinase
MVNTSDKKDFNPNGIGLKNGNFIGLPFTEETAKIVLLPVSWDVTVSYGEGTAFAPQAILDASSQLDLYDMDVKDAWERGIFFQPVNKELLEIRNKLRPKASKYIEFLEQGGDIECNGEIKNLLSEINAECEAMNDFVYKASKRLLDSGKVVGLVGGDHSTPLGYFIALAEKYENFGILHFDAHMDLRYAYEGLTYSHASVFRNVLNISEIKRVVQLGVRDFCEEEVDFAEQDKRICVFLDQQIKEEQFRGITWDEQCGEIVKLLPENVYVSFDVDGLDPKLCPNTGTPVPGGLDFNQSLYLFKKIVQSGRRIIGFDVCETGASEWDANVAARIIYKLCNLVK